MATTVASIIAAIQAQAATTLGASWQVNINPYNLEKLSERTAEKSYATIAQGMSENTDAGAFSRVTYDQYFEVILTRSATGRNDKDEITDAVEDLFNNFDELYKDLVNTKLGLTTTVILVTGLEISDPEILNKSTIVALRGRFLVRWKGDL